VSVQVVPHTTGVNTFNVPQIKGDLTIVAAHTVSVLTMLVALTASVAHTILPQKTSVCKLPLELKLLTYV
jgi:hypothetical protein